jgi:hypothetical protein
MQEIWIPETLIVFFLCLPLIKPYVKKLRTLDGLNWLPLAALLVALSMIPAYGFRPEAFPLLVYAAVLAGIKTLRSVRDNTRHRAFGENRGIFVFLPLVLLAAAAGTVFYFTPRNNIDPVTRGVITLTGHSEAEREYSIRIYTQESSAGNLASPESRRPLMVLLPPAFGSLSAVDQVSSELRDRGFTVLSYARKSYDSHKGFRRLRAFLSGTVSAKANEIGRAMEEERGEDILFLLSWIRQNPRVNETRALFDIAFPEAVFLAGYDAGGSALILSENFLKDSFSRYRLRIRGLIAIESLLWSLYRVEGPVIPDPPRDTGGFQGWFNSIRYGFSRWFWQLQPKKINGLNQVIEPSIPVLFIASDNARETKYSSRYTALLRYFETARSSSLMVSVQGAGPMDYSDFPLKYPLISAMFPGQRTLAENSFETPADCAGIITGFAADILRIERVESNTLNRMPSPAGVHFW